MPNGWDLQGYFNVGRRGAKAGALLSLVGLVVTTVAWIWYGLVGLAWVSILQGIILSLSVLSVGSQGSALHVALRGTKDDSDFMERTRLGDHTYEEIRKLWSEAFSLEHKIRLMAQQSEHS